VGTWIFSTKTHSAKVNLFSKWETKFHEMNSNDIGTTDILTTNQTSLWNFREAGLLRYTSTPAVTSLRIYPKNFAHYTSLLILSRTSTVL
jgi:hypothetical protein